MADDFHAAASWLSSNPSVANLSNETKLEIYGLYKYVNTGAGPTTSRPSMFSPAARAKHDAWVAQSKKYNDIEEVKGRYMEIAKELGWEGGKSGSGGAMGGVKVSVMAQEENVPDREAGSSKLHEAVIDGTEEEIVDLVGAGNSVNTKDEYGLTPLHLAADRGNYKMVELLLELGADRDVKDEDDQTPLMLAEEGGRDDVAHLLRTWRL